MICFPAAFRPLTISLCHYRAIMAHCGVPLYPVHDEHIKPGFSCTVVVYPLPRSLSCYYIVIAVSCSNPIVRCFALTAVLSRNPIYHINHHVCPQ